MCVCVCARARARTLTLQLDLGGLAKPNRRLLVVVTATYVDIVSALHLQRRDRVHMLLGPLVAAKLECGSLLGRPEKLHALDEEGEAQTMLLNVRVLLLWAFGCCCCFVVVCSCVLLCSPVCSCVLLCVPACSCVLLRPPASSCVLLCPPVSC